MASKNYLYFYLCYSFKHNRLSTMLKALYALVSKNLLHHLLKVCFQGEIAALKPMAQSAFSIVCMHVCVCTCTLACMRELKDNLPLYLRQSLFVVCFCYSSLAHEFPGVLPCLPLLSYCRSAGITGSWNLKSSCLQGK